MQQVVGTDGVLGNAGGVGIAGASGNDGAWETGGEQKGVAAWESLGVVRIAGAQGMPHVVEIVGPQPGEMPGAFARGAGAGRIPHRGCNAWQPLQQPLPQPPQIDSTTH
mmetsp:Transcript_23484/g.40536  ORF Transcript_23484/g.40536 Transcript_23484/m.40536 type:complete len:109 (-) Transcript_23484:871-1197(-)